MPLTDATVRNLKPREKPYKVSDFDWLFLGVKPTDSRLWHQKYRINWKEKLLAIGAGPQVTRSVRCGELFPSAKGSIGNP